MSYVNTDISFLSNLPSYLTSISSFILGFLIAIFAEPIRRYLLKPKLNIEFGKSEDFITYTPALTKNNSQTEEYYLRVRVINSRKYIARDCRAFLIDIKKLDDSNKIKSTIYCDSIQLAWSCSGNRKFESLDLTKDVKQYIDVVVLSKESNAIIPQLFSTPFRYLKLFNETGTFIFTIQVSATGIKPKNISIALKWDGNWDDFKAYKYDS